VASSSGGDKFKAKLGQLARNIASAKSVRVGFLEDARYPDGTLVALVAAANEYGSPPKRPPRPFFREFIQEKSPTWGKGIAQALKDSDYDAARALDITGLAVAGQLKQKINEYVGPPLAQSTIDRKGFEKQLIDTSVMINSVDHEVKT
jgi:hypothetical protein